VTRYFAHISNRGPVKYGQIPGAIGVLEAPDQFMPIGEATCRLWDGNGLDEAAEPRNGKAETLRSPCSLGRSGPLAKRFVQAAFRIGFAMRKALSIGRLDDQDRQGRDTRPLDHRGSGVQGGEMIDGASPGSSGKDSPWSR
jgi:hypothetical protein